MLQPSHPSTVHAPVKDHANDPKQSFAIKRRHMTFAQAEHERSQRILQLALLGAGDVIGLECYVCDLATHINSARCTGPCDLFYILKHNFARLQKRHGTQGLGERLREMVVLSLQAYPSRIMHLPLFTAVMKRKLAPPTYDEQTQNQNRQSWLLQVNNSAHRVCLVLIVFDLTNSCDYAADTTIGDNNLIACQSQRAFTERNLWYTTGGTRNSSDLSWRSSGNGIRN